VETADRCRERQRVIISEEIADIGDEAPKVAVITRSGCIATNFAVRYPPIE
jgi:hypothetical protein